MENRRLYPNRIHDKVPLLCGKASHCRENRFRQSISRFGKGVASHEERAVDPITGAARQSPNGLVGMRERDEWQAMVKSRVAGCGCPVCANRTIQQGDNDFATTHPELAKQWHPTKNGALTPQDVTAGTHRKVWWMCEKGHEWQAAVFSRTANGAGCPVCAGKVIAPGENDLRTIYPSIAREWHPTRSGTRTPGNISPYSNRKVWWVCEKGHPY